jgi:hypothetical protein
MPQQAQQYPQQPYMMMPAAAAAAQAQAPPPMWAQQQVQAHQQNQPTSAEEVRTLWIGDLQYWMDENYLFNCFAQAGEVNKLQLHPPNSYLHVIFYYLCYCFFGGLICDCVVS